MNRKLALIFGILFFGSQPAFSQTAPVKYLAGQSEAGQPHLYWFGSAATENDLGFDDGSSELSAFVAETFANNQAYNYFIAPIPFDFPFHLLTEVSVFVEPRYQSDTSSRFAISIEKVAGGLQHGEQLSLDTVEVKWTAKMSTWRTLDKQILFEFSSGVNFWVGLHWLSDNPVNPLLGRDYSGSGLSSFVCYDDSCFQPFLGNWMIRAKTLANNSWLETADSFWIYRGADSINVFHVATIDSGLFDYLDSPSSSGDYYYRITRWQGGVESPPSKAIRLTVSYTAVEDRQIEKHAFLLSEPFPNPTSAGVLFTARTDKQMELGFSIYNLLGQKVFSKPAAGFPAGEHRFFWNGQDGSGRRLPSGLYLLRFQAGEEFLVKKTTLLR